MIFWICFVEGLVSANDIIHAFEGIQGKGGLTFVGILPWN